MRNFSNRSNTKYNEKLAYTVRLQRPEPLRMIQVKFTLIVIKKINNNIMMMIVMPHLRMISMEMSKDGRMQK